MVARGTVGGRVAQAGEAGTGRDEGLLFRHTLNGLVRGERCTGMNFSRRKRISPAEERSLGLAAVLLPHSRPAASGLRTPLPSPFFSGFRGVPRSEPGFEAPPLDLARGGADLARQIYN